LRPERAADDLVAEADAYEGDLVHDGLDVFYEGEDPGVVGEGCVFCAG
jgi:hypothetical protein